MTQHPHHEFGPLPEGHLTRETEGKFLKLRTQMQIVLMKEYLAEKGITTPGTPEWDNGAAEWAEQYSKAFGDIFHRMIIANPHLKEDAETIPDAVLEQIKTELYHSDSTVEPDEYLDDNRAA